MSFACQSNSYQREFDTEVVSCTPAKLKVTQDGKKVTVKGFDVVFKDTILFPEGGGQNCDRGTVDGLPVLNVTRQSSRAIHFVQTDTPLAVGRQLHQVVDWTRRFDHMQQHTGQHLLSAKFERSLNVDTASWWMAERGDSGPMSKVGVSSVELNCEALSEEQLQQIEDECNRGIREHYDVKVKVYSEEDTELAKAHTRGLPDDVHGPIRVINIAPSSEDDGDGAGTIDSNMCCGTHVSNLSHLQAIKLLYAEKSKNKGKTNVYFLVGDRILHYLQTCVRRERQMSNVLQGGPEEHLDLAEKSVRNGKATRKNLVSVIKSLAVMDAEDIVRSGAKFLLKHRPEVNVDYINALANTPELKDCFLCIIVGDEAAGPCQMTIIGPEESVQELGPRIVQLLGGKGGGKGARINAKITSLKGLTKVQEEMEVYFRSNS